MSDDMSRGVYEFYVYMSMSMSFICMSILGAQSYENDRAPLFKLNNIWVIRNNWTSKKVLFLISESNINLHEV